MADVISIEDIRIYFILNEGVFDFTGDSGFSTTGQTRQPDDGPSLTKMPHAIFSSEFAMMPHDVFTFWTVRTHTVLTPSLQIKMKDAFSFLEWWRHNFLS